MIKPTIGRVVLYNDGESDQRVPALICYVHSNDCVNLTVFNQYGNQTGSRTSVHLCQGDEECKVGQAEWMDYQKGQAAKTEKLEQELATQREVNESGAD